MGSAEVLGGNMPQQFYGEILTLVSIGHWWSCYDATHVCASSPRSFAWDRFYKFV